MCGIAGYWGNGDRAVLDIMRESLTHRGPDEGGSVVIGDIGLAHRRLSIVDLSPTGRQPMQNADKSVTLIFNGEIYNYKELQREFLSEIPFKGSSDTEVLLHLYEKFGDSFLEKIKGMFAIALYDLRKNNLLLARDPLGKKPLYWTRTDDTLIFGSELKALRKHPECPDSINRVGIAKYLVYEYIPGTATIYENVYKLTPGTMLRFNGNEVTHDTFYKIAPKQGTYGQTFEEAKTDLTKLIRNAVSKRMVADVPVGVFLSGGLDSSTVAFFAQQSTEHQIKTFSIGFKDASFDESIYAREVATLLGTDHQEHIVGPDDLRNVIQTLPQVLDEPMADSSIIPTLLLSAFTRKEVKVALGGDGADELFWGYDTFFAHRLASWYEKIPKAAHVGIRALVSELPVSHRYMSFDFKAKKFLSGFDTEKSRRNTYWLSAFMPHELSSILNFEVDESIILASSDAYYGEDTHFYDSLQMEYMRGYLAEDILVKTDRAGMAFGLEVRAPFLDIDLVNFAMTLNQKYKIHNSSGKYILKQIMKGYLPDHIIERKKKGFNIPVGAWIQEELRDFFTETILNGPLSTSGLFKREGLAILLESHISGEHDHRKKLWSLLVLALWMKEWHE